MLSSIRYDNYGPSGPRSSIDKPPIYHRVFMTLYQRTQGRGGSSAEEDRLPWREFGFIKIRPVFSRNNFETYECPARGI